MPSPRFLFYALEEVQHGQKLAIVWDERLADEFSRHDEFLHHSQHRAHDVMVTRVERNFHGNNELGDRREDLRAALLQHVHSTLECKETEGLLEFTEAVEEDRQVMVEVELLDFDAPIELAAVAAVLNHHGQVATLIETAEFGRRDLALGKRGALHLSGRRSGDRSVQVVFV